MAEGQIDVAAIEKELAGVADPETGRNLVEMRQVSEIEVADDRISLTLGLTTHSAAIWKDTCDDVEQRLRAGFPQAKDVVVNMKIHERPAAKVGEIGLTAKSVIAVGSGKGGHGQGVALFVPCLHVGDF